MTKKITYFILVFIAALVFLCSCSSTKKMKSRESLKADISTNVTNDSTGLKKVDSVATASKESSNVTSAEANKTKITTDSSSETITVNLATDTAKGGTTANDYEGAPKVFDVNINGHKIHSNQPINSIVIHNKKGSQVIDASTFKIKDSSQQRNNATVNLNKTDSGHVQEKEQTRTIIDRKAKNVTTKRFGVSFNLLVILLMAAVGLFAAWRTGGLTWLLAFFKKKRSDIDKT